VACDDATDPTDSWSQPPAPTPNWSVTVADPPLIATVCAALFDPSLRVHTYVAVAGAVPVYEIFPVTVTCSALPEHILADPTTAGSLTAAATVGGPGGVGVDVGVEVGGGLARLDDLELGLADELPEEEPPDPEAPLPEVTEDGPLVDAPLDEDDDEAEEDESVDDESDDGPEAEEESEPVADPESELETVPELDDRTVPDPITEGVEAVAAGFPVGAVFATTTVVVVATAASPNTAAPTFTLVADPAIRAPRRPDRPPSRAAARAPCRPPECAPDRAPLADRPESMTDVPDTPPPATAPPVPPPSASSGKAAIITATAAARSRVPRAFQSGPYPATATRSRCARKVGTS